MHRRTLPRTVPVAVAVLVALGLSLLFLAGRPPASEATETATRFATDAGRSAADTTRSTAHATSTVTLDSATVLAETIAPSDTPPPGTSPAPPPGPRYRAGEDPNFATRMGWPVSMPAALPGAILPNRRIVAYYGNPLSKRMGVLGEYPREEMLRRFERELDEWRRADPQTPVQPALHLISVVASGEPGPSGKYRTIMRDTVIEKVYSWAKEKDGILFIDIQVGHSDVRDLVPRFEKFLSRPDVHLAIDPEFMMKSGHKPGAKIGTMDAADINFAADYLARLVRKHNLPPKVLIIHRFTRGMVTNSRAIKLRPEVQIVMHMDGWGAPFLKRDSYRDYIVREPVQFTGFKLFYHNDTKKGHPLMTPADLLKLRPVPLYIQYQ
jgi:hypothetical protein